jgi:hypothetical protein
MNREGRIKYRFIEELSTQGIIERCGHTLGTSSTYQNKKNVHIDMCPEAFNL